MNALVTLVVAVEVATLLWYGIDRLGRVLVKRKGSVLSGIVRRAIINAVFETLVVVYQTVSHLLSLLLSHVGVIALVALLVIVGVAVATAGPELLLSVDALYEHMYYPLIHPVMRILNVVRLLYDTVIGVWNVLAMMVGSPLLRVLRDVAVCTTEAGVFRDLQLMSSGLGDFVAEASAAMVALNASRPFNGSFSTKWLQVGVDVLDTIECSCAIDRGILYAPLRSVMTSPFAPALVGDSLSLAVSVVVVPISAAQRLGWTVKSGTWNYETGVYLDPVFDNLQRVTHDIGVLKDTAMRKFLEALQQVVSPERGWFV